MNLWGRLRGVLPRFRASADYEAASATRRTSGWTPPTSDINTLVFRNTDTLRSRSRDMVRRNPWATNALDAFVANSIGTGIKPQSLHPDAATKEQIQSLWLRWTDEADATGQPQQPRRNPTFTLQQSTGEPLLALLRLPYRRPRRQTPRPRQPSP